MGDVEAEAEKRFMSERPGAEGQKTWKRGDELLCWLMRNAESMHVASLTHSVCGV